MYDLVAFIPCERCASVGIWWKLGRLGYKVEYVDGRARVSGYNKSEDDLAEFKTALRSYHGGILFIRPS